MGIFSLNIFYSPANSKSYNKIYTIHKAIRLERKGKRKELFHIIEYTML